MVLNARKLLSAGICAGALLLAASAEAAPVVFSGYTFDTNGRAADNSSSSKLELTYDWVQAGSAFTPLTLTNDGVATPLQFDFTFQIGPVRELGIGDGFAFVLQHDSRGASALGGAGSDLGYGGSAGPITPSLIVEFDTFSLYDLAHGAEPQAPHVALQKDGDSDSHNAQAILAPAPSFTDGDVWHAQVKIDGGNLSVYLDKDGSFTTALFQTGLTDTLRNLLGVGADGLFYAGFTGGTGGNANVQDILSFSAIVAPAEVPLPAAAWLLLSGLGGLVAVARRRRGTSAIAA